MSTLAGLYSSENAPDFLKECIDLDSHEMAPLQLWADLFGPGAAEFIALCENGDAMRNNGSNTLHRADLVRDEVEVSDETVWQQKGPGAPSAFDFNRRTAVMDQMGIAKQLVYPGFGLMGTMLAYHPNAGAFWGIDTRGIDIAAMAARAVAQHNQWCVMQTARHGDRMRFVPILLSTSLDAMEREARTLIGGGIRTIMLPAGIPPAGMSPADARLDPFWSLLAGAGVAVTFHIGTEFPFLRHCWDANVPAFEGAATLEINIQPYWGSTLHYACENFLTTLVLGGVLERHPGLKLGAIEVGAGWVGSWSERMDAWAQQFSQRLDTILSLAPSQYVNRQLRVTPFHFEDVALYFARHPTLENVYAFSTDFPHSEGGRDSKEAFLANLADTDIRIVEKFFRSNGAYLFDDAR